MSDSTLTSRAADVLATRSADLTAIERQLKEVVEKAGETTFLIVSSGDYYVQYIANPGGKSLSVEAVSNENLSPQQRISEAQIAELQSLGFDLPEKGFNFSLEHEASSERDLAEMAALALVALFAIYRCPPDATLDYELSL